MIYYIIFAWILCMAIGLWMRAQLRDQLTVGDLVFALLFGPIYTLWGFADWDAPIWKRKK